MQQLDDPLVALARYGAFTSTPDCRHYFGRYALRGLFGKDEVQPLIDAGHAEALTLSDVKITTIVPTKAGLEEAARRLPIDHQQHDEKLAIVGVRNWELHHSLDTPIVGLFVASDAASDLLFEILDSLEMSRRPRSLHFTTIGGVVPSALANDLPGEELEDAPNFEHVRLPPELAPITNLFWEYEFTLDTRPQHGIAVLFMTAGHTVRLIGTLTLKSLVTAITNSAPSLAEFAKELKLDKALAQYKDTPRLEPLL